MSNYGATLNSNAESVKAHGMEGKAERSLPPMTERGADTMPRQNTVQIRTSAPAYYWDCDRCGRCPCACQFKV